MSVIPPKIVARADQAQAAAKQQVLSPKKGAAPAKHYVSEAPPASGGLVIQSSPKDMGTVVVK